jgi:ABC-type polysaccharide/polyol phosphate transport system ATPase subunit
MADDIVIRAEELGKKYVIGHEAQRERYVALRDVIARSARNAWRMAADMAKGRVVVPGDTVEELWALKGVSFEVKRGEVLGIIGRNGAGKSTLLKILSRITEPTEGRVTIKGRVASLLEVGTGFHPELTGRENIYLNGAILGMTRAEIKRKFDEIVAFAEIEKFLDTPVKRYSSGMYVRLAFAVAAHLEPEILVVDEVLAVGDAEFQKKCLGKMQDIAGRGRTVLFVSHNIDAIERLCTICLTLNAGKILGMQPVSDAVIKYIQSQELLTLDAYRSARYRRTAEIVSLEFEPTTQSVILLVRPRDRQPRDLSVVLHDNRQSSLFATHLTDMGDTLRTDNEVRIAIPLPVQNLRPGHYFMSVASFDPTRTHFFDVLMHVPIQITSQAMPLASNDSRWGALYFPLRWNVRPARALERPPAASQYCD